MPNTSPQPPISGHAILRDPSACAPAIFLLEADAAEPAIFQILGDTTPTSSRRETPLGPASTRTHAGEHPSGYRFTWSLTELEGTPNFTLQMSFENRSDKPVRLREFQLGSTTLATKGEPSDWWISCLDSYDSSGGGFQPASDLSAARAARFLDSLKLYTDSGRSGVLMGAVGPAVSDVRFHCDVAPSGVGVRISSEMNDVIVDPGESRVSEEVLVQPGPYEPAVADLFRWIAATHGSRTAKGPVFGWCSWYDCKGRITEWHTLGVARAAANSGHVPFQVIQVDDGWEKSYGDWSIEPMRFPSGLKNLADRLRAYGTTPGIWMCLVRSSEKGAHPDGGTGEYLDATHPGVIALIRQSIADRRAEGYEYFKLDFNTPRIEGRFDQKKTRLEVLRDLFKLYRECVGEENYLLACVGGLARGCFGYADASRIGTDSCDNWGDLFKGTCILDCIHSVGSTAPANGVLFAADPDVTYAIPRGTLDLDEVRTWHGFVGLFGGLMLVSEPLHEPPYDEPENIRMLEILDPPAPDKGRSFDAATDPYHRRFGFLAERPWGNFASILLWNPDSKPGGATLGGLPLDALGARFHAWSFWDEKYLGITGADLALTDLPPHGSVILRLTPADARPALVGSNLHIALGSAEILDWSSTDTEIRITLRGEAGAREGALFLASEKPLTLTTASACEAYLQAAGRNLWKLTLRNRSRTTNQTLLLTL